MEIVGYLLALLVGITLGLVGSGGSILTVPILVYLIHIKPQLATTYSLFIVGIAAVVGAFRHYQLKNLQFQTAIYFGIPSIISLLLTRKFIVPNLPDYLFVILGFQIAKNVFIMIVFAVLMLMAAYSMLNSMDVKKSYLPTINFKKLSVIGFVIGIIAGFLGAGGGFLIIPSLIFFGGLQMKQAVGTSLLIISVNSLLGFAGDLLAGIQPDLKLLSIFTSLAVVGIFIGTQLSKKVDGNKLKPIFAWFIVVMGIYIILKETLL
ncbi:MAG: hypothetical protein RIQ33_339 [Bacteroidota bacterium]|jgi:uncharacterized membrane protein YfcA